MFGRDLGESSLLGRRISHALTGISDKMLDAGFWVSLAPNAHALLALPETIRQMNVAIVEGAPSVVSLALYPEVLEREALIARIESVSVRPQAPRFDFSGRELTESEWAGLFDSLAREAVPGRVAVQWGVAVRRSPMRSFPTDLEVYKQPGEYDLERFMETTVYPGEPLALLWNSRDGEWLLAQMYNYLGWIRRRDVAVASGREALGPFLGNGVPLVVTGRQVTSAWSPGRPDISELLLDMGAHLPLLADAALPPDVAGQSIVGNHVVLAPRRGGGSGALFVESVLLSRGADVSVGPLPFARSLILRQAFKLLGERYGWGGMYHARDCSSLIMDVFRCFGLRLPRNAGQQANLPVGRSIEFPASATLTERQELLGRVPAGAALFLEGHVMLYLGRLGGEFYALHDLYEYYEVSPQNEGTLRRYPANQVMVTPLSIRRSNGATFLESLTSARDFVPA
jgi:cell wall-associated NlpC family hydrolase